jgi:hypothetical protein
VTTGDTRLDDALALGWHAADLAGWAVTLASPGHDDDPALDVATALTHTAASITALATALAGRHQAARRGADPQPGDPR